jgi:hypothetical protein
MGSPAHKDLFPFLHLSVNDDVALLGQGGSAHVYRVSNKKREETFVVKDYDIDPSDGHTVFERTDAFEVRKREFDTAVDLLLMFGDLGDTPGFRVVKLLDIYPKELLMKLEDTPGFTIKQLIQYGLTRDSDIKEVADLYVKNADAFTGFLVSRGWMFQILRDAGSYLGRHLVPGYICRKTTEAGRPLLIVIYPDNIILDPKTARMTLIGFN